MYNKQLCTVQDNGENDGYGALNGNITIYYSILTISPMGDVRLYTLVKMMCIK